MLTWIYEERTVQVFFYGCVIEVYVLNFSKKMVNGRGQELFFKNQKLFS
jgi:hypothetical protein